MIYLDSAATTRPSRAVAEAVAASMTERFGNPSSLHRLGFLSEKAIAESRESVARLIGVPSGQLVFTSGGTEANQLAIRGAAARRGGAVLMAATEHSSVFDAIDASRRRIIPVDPMGRLDWDEMRRLLSSEEVCLVCAMHVNNEIGTIHPLARIRALIDETGSGAFLHVDGVQGCAKTDVRRAIRHADSYAVSGHKFHALKGIGALYVRDWSRIAPQQPGGGQEFGRRAGTENLTGIVSMGVAAERALAGEEQSRADARTLRQAFLDQIRRSVDGVTVGGDPESSSDYIVSVSLESVRSEVLVHMLEMRGIYISTRSACSSKSKVSRVLRALGYDAGRADGTIRVSFGIDSAAELGFEADLSQRVDAAVEAARVIGECVREIRSLTRRR